MTDVKSLDPATESELREAIELLYFAYRGFTAEPDAILAEMGMGRAHHRVIYFVGRQPGMTVSELLAILRITKQSLARVLSSLVRQGYVIQTPGPRDRRQRLLRLTEAGQALERRLTLRQGRLIAEAYRRAGGDGIPGFLRVLEELVSEGDRTHLRAPESPRRRAP